MIVKNVAIPILLRALLAAAPARGQGNIQAIVTNNVQPLLSESGAGGVAVAVRMNGRTEFFNYGFANLARNERVTADSLFNLGSVGKLFAPTLLAEAVKRGELSLDDSVAKYVTELQKGGDIRRVTLGQLASHTSGLPRVPQQYEGWHRGNTRGRTLFASYEFVEGWSELRAWETVSLIQRCHGFVARGARTPIQHSICGVNARTDHRTAWNELYRAAVATWLTWARRAGLRPGRTPCRQAG